VRLLRVALAGMSVAIFLVLLPYLDGFIPLEVQFVICHPLFWLGLAVPPVCLGAARFTAVMPRYWAARFGLRARPWLGSGPVVAAVLSWAVRVAAVCRRADSAASRLLGPLTVALGVVCVVFLATWVPHYLTWPIWVDTDQFMISARAWDAGLRPYRDL